AFALSRASRSLYMEFSTSRLRYRLPHPKADHIHRDFSTLRPAGDSQRSRHFRLQFSGVLQRRFGTRKRERRPPLLGYLQLDRPTYPFRTKTIAKQVFTGFGLHFLENPTNLARVAIRQGSARPGAFIHVRPDRKGPTEGP